MVVLIPIELKNASPTIFNLPTGLVVPTPTEPKTAVACWKSTSAAGVAEPNPRGPETLSWPNVDTPDVVNIFASSV